MLNSPAQTDIQRFTMTQNAVVEERLPIGEDAHNSLSGVLIGLAGAVLVAGAILVLRMIGAV